MARVSDVFEPNQGLRRFYNRPNEFQSRPNEFEFQSRPNEFQSRPNEFQSRPNEFQSRPNEHHPDKQQAYPVIHKSYEQPQTAPQNTGQRLSLPPQNIAPQHFYQSMNQPQYHQTYTPSPASPLSHLSQNYHTSPQNLTHVDSNAQARHIMSTRSMPRYSYHSQAQEAVTAASSAPQYGYQPTHAAAPDNYSKTSGFSGGMMVHSRTPASHSGSFTSLPQYQQYLNETNESGFTKYEMEDGSVVIGERVIEHEVKVPKKIIREDLIEKVIVIPEKVVHEEMVEEIATIREKVIEVAKPVYHEKIVEIPDIEYIEKIVEVPQKVYQEKIKEVPRVQYVERVVEVPKVVTKERVVEVPDVEYREVPVERVVEVPEYREKQVTKEVVVPQVVYNHVPDYVDVPVSKDVDRNIPVPVEAVSNYEFRLPQLEAKYNSVELPLYVPRFIEVPVPAEFMDKDALAQAEHYSSQVKVLAQQQAASLCEVENLAGAIKSTDFTSFMNKDMGSALLAAWQAGRLTT